VPQVGFELTTPAFERTTTVHASDNAATVIVMLILSGLYVRSLWRYEQNWHKHGPKENLLNYEELLNSSETECHGQAVKCDVLVELPNKLNVVWAGHVGSVAEISWNLHGP
jgi:hypothetical protein